MTSQVTELRGIELEAWINFLRAHSAVTRQFNAELLATHGLTINDYDVLAQLSRAPEQALRRVDLAESVLLTPSGITRLLKGLEDRRLGQQPPVRGGRARDLRRAHGRGKEEARARPGRRMSRACARSSPSASSKDELETLASLLERLPLTRLRLRLSRSSSGR